MATRKYDFASVGVETGTQPSAGTPSADDDLITLGYFNNNAGGGGGSLQWRAIGPNAASVIEENLERVFELDTNQSIYASTKVPQSYGGAQIQLFTSWYFTNNGVTSTYESTTTLIRAGTDLITSTTNQEVDSTQTIASATVDQVETLTFDLTNASGQINSVAVSAGDLILIALKRTDALSGTAKFVENGTELKFS